ncbi:hypothetical protein DM01DRAFT_1335133 [Hesseltinella vesiculosa]|uniref:Uncharacterized protein n=1 Tax=Hesseltinella vesiculosa TaxID=101127 RepID=A0A1X2GKB9_9FUNG|nr:hypothetical protein DM01DRAFT_1335133 [Hesseltinella vesiculosa]
MALRVNGDIWLFDCGEATQHQFQKSQLKMGRITKIFITHMHGDHCFGLGPLLCSTGTNTGGDSADPSYACPPLEIYGPSRLRQWLRTTMKSTYTTLERTYRVHEILFPDDPEDANEQLYSQELPGENLRLTSTNDLPLAVQLDIGAGFKVTATPIKHSIPSIGFVIQEPDILGTIDIAAIRPVLLRNADALLAQGIKQPLSLLGKLQRSGQPIDLPDGTRIEPPSKVPGRQVVILGDTCDPSNIASFCSQPQLLVHEATNALTSMDAGSVTEELVEERCIAHGHSTPQMAGAFAKRLGAHTLILTHFSSRYKGDESPESLSVMEEVRQLALGTFGQDKDKHLHCARDFYEFQIKL